MTRLSSLKDLSSVATAIDASSLSIPKEASINQLLSTELRSELIHYHPPNLYPELSIWLRDLLPSCVQERDVERLKFVVRVVSATAAGAQADRDWEQISQALKNLSKLPSAALPQLNNLSELCSSSTRTSFEDVIKDIAIRWSDKWKDSALLTGSELLCCEDPSILAAETVYKVASSLKLSLSKDQVAAIAFVIMKAWNLRESKFDETLMKRLSEGTKALRSRVCFC